MRIVSIGNILNGRPEKSINVHIPVYTTKTSKIFAEKHQSYVCMWNEQHKAVPNAFYLNYKNRGERKRERERARGNQFIRWSLFYVNFGTLIVHWLHQPHWKHWLVFGVYAINIETVSTPKCPSNVQILFSLCSSLNFASPSDWKETFANGVCTHICEIYVGILVVKNKNQIKVEWKRNHWHTKKAHARSPP